MQEKVSVIVPIYNVEKYLRRCVDSLVRQVHKNIEILLIDDCSTDESSVIAREYAAKYPQLCHYIHSRYIIFRHPIITVNKRQPFPR